MAELILEEIANLVVDKMGKYRKPLTRQTSLEKDLGMSGDDAVEFLLEFSKKFNVDIGNFKFKECFSPEGDFILPAILRFLTGKKSEKHAELTLGDLERAVLAGRLDDNTIRNE